MFEPIPSSLQRTEKGSLSQWATNSVDRVIPFYGTMTAT